MYILVFLTTVINNVLRNLTKAVILLLCTVTAMALHRRSQDFLCGALFFPEKVDNLNNGLKPKLTTPTVQISQLPKNGLLLCLGVHALPGGAVTTFPCNVGPQFFSPPWGCTCTQCTPRLRL